MSSDMVVASPQEGDAMAVARSALSTGGGLPRWTSISALTEEGRELMYRAQRDELPRATDSMGKRMKLRDILAQQVIVPSIKDRAELVQLTRIVLVGEDGSMVEAMGKGISGCVQDLAECYGLPPWCPPLHVEIGQKRLRSGLMMPVLLLVGKEAIHAKKSK